jgi:hypothetical protein
MKLGQATEQGTLDFALPLQSMWFEQDIHTGKDLGFSSYSSLIVFFALGDGLARIHANFL